MGKVCKWQKQLGDIIVICAQSCTKSPHQLCWALDLYSTSNCTIIGHYFCNFLKWYLQDRSIRLFSIYLSLLANMSIKWNLLKNCHSWHWVEFINLISVNGSIKQHFQLFNEFGQFWSHCIKRKSKRYLLTTESLPNL